MQLWSESDWVRENSAEQAEACSTAVLYIYTYFVGIDFELIQRRALKRLFA